MDNNFLSKENKALIWQFLTDAGAFLNIPDEYYQRVQNIYETTLLEINKIKNVTLTETIIAIESKFTKACA